MKPLRLTRPEPTEAEVTRAVKVALSYCKSVARFWRANTGSGRLKRANGDESQWIEFGFEGCPDIHGFMRDGRALFIEVKRPSGIVAPAQAEFIRLARAAGCVAFVARSADCVMREIPK